ncbi:MAG: hypothetical protein OXN17_07805 [Candidatus Poribacteria bacterium]|nr:hypothetical protein [Candidatus Poribacteria bacterium]MDE0504411.1 hypothetical protein [Candidatus Poribacteria bacterium]
MRKSLAILVFWLAVVFVLLVIIKILSSSHQDGLIEVKINDTEVPKETSVIENLEATDTALGKVDSPADDFKIPITVAARSIVNEYEKNEIKADLTYKGEVIFVTGYVFDIEKRFGKVVVLIEGEDWAHVQCELQESETLKAANLIKGYPVTALGVVSGKGILGYVNMESCILYPTK